MSMEDAESIGEGGDSEEAERKEFQGEGTSMVLGRLINYA